MVGLADCNNFFVSCERSRNPALEGRPVVVLSNNDGCVVARSNESKRMGVRMGQPAFELRRQIESGQLIALSGDHLLYRDISLKVHDIFRRFVPSSIDYSVDEAFLDVNGIPLEVLPSIGEAIYTTCLSELKIPVTIGFAPTKTLAKLSTETCKKRGQSIGLLFDDDEIKAVLDSLSISELWGIGRRLAKRLYQSGVYTIGDFARRDRMWVKKYLGINGERSWLELHCQPCIELSHVERALQDSVSESRTFPEDIDDYDYIRARIVIYASDCAKKLRAMKGKCGSVGVFLRTNPFRQQLTNIKPEGMVKLPNPSSDTPSIVEAALHILDNIYPQGIMLKRAGVWLGEIVPDRPAVGSLFEPTATPQDASVNRLMQALDRINATVGKKTLSLASQLVKGQRGHNDGYSSSFQAPKK
ncbi:MAG: Y-family DNA polymerase [Muribaculaceae bacterium]|nr:Y-family DNA polymerase [Muribaculaceae bacterium]